MKKNQNRLEFILVQLKVGSSGLNIYFIAEPWGSQGMKRKQEE